MTKERKVDLMDKPQPVVINIRIDAETLKRIDEQTEKFREMIPYFSRNQMVNLLLVKGLDLHEQTGESNHGIYTDRQ